MGESSVMVVRPSKKSIRTNRNNYYGVRMDVRLYLEGNCFKSRCTAPYGYAFMDWNFCP